DGSCDLLVSQPRLVWSNQPKDTGHEVVGGGIDADFGRDAIPGSSPFVGETDPHELRPLRPRRRGPLSVKKDSTCHQSGCESAAPCAVGRFVGPTTWPARTSSRRFRPTRL